MPDLNRGALAPVADEVTLEQLTVQEMDRRLRPGAGTVDPANAGLQ